MLCVERSAQHLSEVGARTELMQLLREAVDDVRYQSGTLTGSSTAAPLRAPRVSSASTRRTVMGGGGGGGAMGGGVGEERRGAFGLSMDQREQVLAALLSKEKVSVSVAVLLFERKSMTETACLAQSVFGMRLAVGALQWVARRLQST